MFHHQSFKDATVKSVSNHVQAANLPLRTKHCTCPSPTVSPRTRTRTHTHKVQRMRMDGRTCTQ